MNFKNTKETIQTYKKCPTTSFSLFFKCCVSASFLSAVMSVDNGGADDGKINCQKYREIYNLCILGIVGRNFGNVWFQLKNWVSPSKCMLSEAKNSWIKCSCNHRHGLLRNCFPQEIQWTTSTIFSIWVGSIFIISLWKYRNTKNTEICDLWVFKPFQKF